MSVTHTVLTHNAAFDAGVRAALRRIERRLCASAEETKAQLEEHKAKMVAALAEGKASLAASKKELNASIGNHRRAGHASTCKPSPRTPHRIVQICSRSGCSAEQKLSWLRVNQTQYTPMCSLAVSLNHHAALTPCR